MKKLTIIVLTWNGLENLKTLIPSIISQTYKNFELLVCVNGSVDGSDRWLKKQKIKTIILKQNQGFSGGNNVALETVKTPFVALVSDDIKLEPDCIQELMAFMGSKPHVGAVQPKILSFNGKYLESTGLEVTYGSMIATKGKYDSPNNCNENMKVIGTHAACSVYRMDVLHKIKFFDENFNPVYYEDADLAFRIGKAGYEQWYVAGATAFHKSGDATKRMGYEARLSWHRNRYRFLKKHWTSGMWLKTLPFLLPITIFYTIKHDKAYFVATWEFLTGKLKTNDMTAWSSY